VVARRAARHGVPALQAILLNQCGACARGSGLVASQPGFGAARAGYTGFALGNQSLIA